MSQQMQQKGVQFSPLWAGLLCMAIYLLFPTHNSTSDAYGYALGAEIGPHHILFDLLTQWLRTALNLRPLEVLATMKIINGIAGGIALVYVGKLLQQLEVEHAFWFALLCGVSFGIMRFATENEAYILPLAAALAGTFYYFSTVKIKSSKSLLLAWLLIALAILFHQSYVFWAVATVVSMALRRIPLRQWLFPLIAAILVILVYAYFAAINHQALTHWMVEDAREGLVDLSPGSDNFKFTAINFIRSFAQIHGNIPILLKGDIFLWILAGLSLLLSVIGIVYFIMKISPNIYSTKKHYLHFLILVFTFHLGFAWFSVGNAEFMVMLPTIHVIIISILFTANKRSIAFIAIGLGLWNLSVSLIPNSYKDLNNHSIELAVLGKYSDGIFISHHKIELENYAAVQDKKTVLPELLKSPAEIENEETLSMAIAVQQRAGKKVYTDCIHYPETQSRKKLLGGNKNEDFFEQYQSTVVDSFATAAGWVYISRLESKKKR